MSIALDLARCINALRFDDLPQQAVHWARIGVLDTVGVTLAGSHDPSAQIVAHALTLGSGPALLFGSNRRVSMLDAALVNGTASHALDFDDCSNTLGGHPSVPILPALFALADDNGCTGRDLIVAYVAGFETECKISLGVNFYQYTRGWHPTTTIGVFGAAAACSRLLRLNHEQTATALAIAASFASGIKANFGTMTKPLHIGQCARNGLFAALLARDGLTANPFAFEHKQGYLEVFNGAGNYDVTKMVRAWGKPFDIVEPGIALKQYPCCGSTHPAIDALLEIVLAHDVHPDEVVRVDAWTHPICLAHTNRPAPESTKDAKFSVQYCLAVALTDRRVAIEDFEGDRFRDFSIRATMDRVHAAPYTDAQFPLDNYFAAEVKVALRDGTIHEARVEEPLGCTSANPLPAELIHSKFLNCAQRVLSAASAHQLAAMIERLENVADVREITRLIAEGQ